MNALRSLNRRRFLQSTGFLALSFPISLDPAFGAEKSGKLPGSLADNPMLSAWLRINADKSVTLLIGKVELGQGALTAIGQVCADELVVNYDRLQSHLRRHGVVAERRHHLGLADNVGRRHRCSGGIRRSPRNSAGLAAVKLGQPVGGMKIKDGTITAANGKSVTYWELVTGKELERQATGAGQASAERRAQYIGKSYPRVDILAKMTGAAIFIQDMKPEGTMFGAVVRPPTYKADARGH